MTADSGPNDPRIASRLLDQHRDTLRLLDLAVRRAHDLGISLEEVERQIDLIQGRIPYLEYKSRERIESRKQPKLQPYKSSRGRPVFDVFLDESGLRDRTPQPRFGVFAVAAVVVSHEHLADVAGPKADALKQEHFGSDAVIFHEPGMRGHDGSFYFDGDSAKQRARP